MLIVTGPNMGGKSTFLRQNALIAILAQMGSFVPATSAHIGIVDRLFSRVGASDDLARGRSTFMVEMVETAAILNQASDRSLVILDEIGRGTATFDGLSIAWAAVEHLHEANRCRGLFATHFHELTVLSEKLNRLSNATMRVKEWDGDVIFLHEVGPGAADRSYGIQVARLAGLPASVVARARDVLTQLEDTDRKNPASQLIDDLPLFQVAVRREEQKKAGPSRIEEALKAIEYPDVVSIQIIYNLFRQRPADLFFKEARRKNVAVIVRVPLASGLLSGKINRETAFAADDHRNFNRHGEAFDVGETFAGVPFEVGLQAVEEVRKLVPAGASMAAFALKWILTNEAVTVVIPGARNAEQARSNAAAADLAALSDDVMTATREVYARLIAPHVHQRW